MEDSYGKHKVRPLLNRLRQMWDMHSPTVPFCLVDELVSGVTISEFCVQHLKQHRGRRTTVFGVTPSEETTPRSD